MGCREKNRKIEVNRFFHMMNQWMEGFFFTIQGEAIQDPTFRRRWFFLVFFILAEGVVHRNCLVVWSLEPWNFLNFHSVGNGKSSLTNSIIFQRGR